MSPTAAVFARVDADKDGHCTRTELVHGLDSDVQLRAALELPAGTSEADLDAVAAAFQVCAACMGFRIIDGHCLRLSDVLTYAGHGH